MVQKSDDRPLAVLAITVHGRVAEVYVVVRVIAGLGAELDDGAASGRLRRSRGQRAIGIRR
jgi:hypothetical protein